MHTKYRKKRVINVTPADSYTTDMLHYTVKTVDASYKLNDIKVQNNLIRLKSYGKKCLYWYGFVIVFVCIWHFDAY